MYDEQAALVIVYERAHARHAQFCWIMGREHLCQPKERGLPVIATIVILAIVLVLVMAFSLYGGPGGVGPVRARRRTVVDRPVRPARRRRVVEERIVEEEPPVRRFVEEDPPGL